jgi:cobalt/nickel transport protein
MKSCVAILAFVIPCAVAAAHVQVMVPTEQTADAQAGAVREMDMRFVVHAMENGPALPMPAPKQFGVVVNGKKQDLRDNLKAGESDGQPAYTSKMTMKEPGAHVFYLEPGGYWDQKERVIVSHYTKVILNSCNSGIPTESEMGWENYEGWDALVGLPVEIEPLVNCTAMWTNSIFRGIVRVNGKPAPLCRIEVEYLNKDHAVKAPNNAFITQVLKANQEGEFAFVPVRAGWWALSAIPESQQTIKSPDGDDVPNELGGVLWIRCVDMK